MKRSTHIQISAALEAKVWVALLALAFLSPHELLGQDRGASRFLDWSYQDGAALLSDMGPRTPIWLLGGLVVTASVSALDPGLRREVRAGYHGRFARYLDVTNELGGPWATPVVTGIFGVSVLSRNSRFQDAAFTSLQSLVYAGLITRSLKGVFGRYRPEQFVGAYHFRPFSGHTSFPSGHTTAAFAIVTPWVLYYPSPATHSLYALAAGTAAARVAKDKHWPTDVVVGATIGILTGRFLTRRHTLARGGGWIDVQPVFYVGGAGVRAQMNLR